MVVRVGRAIASLFTSWLRADLSKISLGRIIYCLKKKPCTLHEDLQMPGIRHARCPAKPLVVSLEMRSFHSKKEVRLQRGKFIWLRQYVGCSKNLRKKCFVPTITASPGCKSELLKNHPPFSPVHSPLLFHQPIFRMICHERFHLTRHVDHRKLSKNIL